MQNDPQRSGNDDDGGAPLGSWRNLHLLVLGVLGAIVAFGTLLSWIYG